MFSPPGLDFSSASHFVTVNQSQFLKEIIVYIDIIDDEVSELPEVFVLHLRDATSRTGAAAETEVNIGRDVSIARITEPGM